MLHVIPVATSTGGLFLPGVSGPPLTPFVRSPKHWKYSSLHFSVPIFGTPPPPGSPWAAPPPVVGSAPAAAPPPPPAPPSPDWPDTAGPPAGVARIRDSMRQSHYAVFVN